MPGRVVVEEPAVTVPLMRPPGTREKFIVTAVLATVTLPAPNWPGVPPVAVHHWLAAVLVAVSLMTPTI